MTFNQLKKRLEYEHTLIAINHEWWEEQLGNTLAELDYLSSLAIISKRNQKRIEFLENRLEYLQKKAKFENKTIRRFDKKIKQLSGG